MTQTSFAAKTAITVEEAIARLKARLQPIGGSQSVALAESAGRVLAQDVHARRAHPPLANSAVDGFGFAHAHAGPVMELAQGHAAPGHPFAGNVAPGQALRILTGANPPPGVDTVVMQEDTRIEGGRLHLTLPDPGANIRPAGEDVARGALVLPAGHRLRPADLALLAAVGVAEVSLRPDLRVGVISTGDELFEAGEPAHDWQIWDANRPMLLAMVSGWGFEAVDLGIIPDDRAAIRATLDRAVHECDVILTSGGASVGDADHISRLLRDDGALTAWQIAMKPGRPLALARWRGVDVFGLPGNPVAAFVCALIFARPALWQIAGAGWVEPISITAPAAFSRQMRAGRREWLRARLDANGSVAVFTSEGSGRISGISWATGLCDLGSSGRMIMPGDPVRFLPFAGFGIG